MKTKQELEELKQEVKDIDKQLSELTEEELEQVCGGIESPVFHGYEPSI